jgi:predicted nicotinamide N-methyase
MAPNTRAFVLRHTRLQPVPGSTGMRLHLADDVLGLWRAVQLATRDPEAGLPYWAFAWAGGLAIARHIGLHPAVVTGRRVFDLASGSGLCAIAAMQHGAAMATAADIDPFAAAALSLNARANGVPVTSVARDVLEEDPPDVDLILAGDCCYDATLSLRAFAWLERAEARGIEVLVGDPGRRYLPAGRLVELASYDVRTTTDLEDMEHKRAWVFTLQASGGATRAG